MLYDTQGYTKTRPPPPHHTRLHGAVVIKQRDKRCLMVETGFIIKQKFGNRSVLPDFVHIHQSEVISDSSSVCSRTVSAWTDDDDDDR